MRIGRAEDNDLVIDDLMLNCIEVVSASPAKAILMLRDGNETTRRHAMDRGIGVVARSAHVTIAWTDSSSPNAGSGGRPISLRAGALAGRRRAIVVIPSP